MASVRDRLRELAEELVAYLESLLRADPEDEFSETAALMQAAVAKAVRRKRRSIEELIGKKFVWDERGTKLKFAGRLPGRSVESWIFTSPDEEAGLWMIWEGEGKLVVRVYFDQGNVPDEDVIHMITMFKSRYKQPQRGGRPTSALYDEARERFIAGEDPRELRKEYVAKVTQQIIENEWGIEHPGPAKIAEARRLARDRVYRGFKRRGIPWK